jgi:DnaJ-class molecular chaperone
MSDEEAETCRACEGSGEVFVKRDRNGRVDYLSGRVINNETTRCDRCKGEGVEP